MDCHYIPRALLRGFCEANAPGFLWMYDKQNREFRRARVETVAHQRNFYPPGIERELNTLVEIPGNAAITALRRDQTLTPEQRANLAVYVATMQKRVPRFREWGMSLVPKVLETIVRELKENLVALGEQAAIDTAIVRLRLAEADAVKEKFEGELPSECREVILSPWPSKRITSVIYSMTWRFVSVESPAYFITSDNPCCYFEDRGLFRPESELTFPLSSGLALIGGWQSAGPKGKLKARPFLAKEVNRRVAASAGRFLFSSEREPWIAELAHKTPNLSTIQW